MSYNRLFDGMTIDGFKVDTSQLAETGKVFVGDEEWDASDLITEEDEIYVFNEDMLRTKADLLADIDSLLSRIDDEKIGDTKHSQAYYVRYAALIKKFRGIVERSSFPEKLEDWWFYEYEISETGITLSLSHADYINLNNEGFIDEISTDTEFNLLQVNAEMLTVEQYAQANDVTASTVRQWIRRGKIRTAVKQGGEWRIPELAEVRDRGYKYVQYRWEEYLTGFPEEYAFINDYHQVGIMQDEEDKGNFEIYLRNGDVNKTLQMDQKEKEKFELLLISNPFIKPVGSSIVHRG